MIPKGVNPVLKAFIEVNVVDCRVPSSFGIENTIAIAAIGKTNKDGLLSFNYAGHFSQRVIWNQVMRITPKKPQLVPSSQNTSQHLVRGGGSSMAVRHALVTMLRIADCITPKSG